MMSPLRLFKMKMKQTSPYKMKNLKKRLKLLKKQFMIGNKLMKTKQFG